MNAQGEFNHGAFVNKSESDVAVLEDKSGRITIKNSDIFKIDQFVSGTILALRGKAINGGYFEVKDFCFAGLPFREPAQQAKNISSTRLLYEEKALRSDRKFVAFVSGMQFGKPVSNI